MGYQDWIYWQNWVEAELQMGREMLSVEVDKSPSPMHVRADTRIISLFKWQRATKITLTKFCYPNAQRLIVLELTTEL